MSKKTTKMVSLCLAAIAAGSMFGACRKGGSASEVQFWVRGNAAQLNMYTKMVNEFNDSYGKAHGVKVNISAKPNDAYANNVQIMVSTDAGPDIFLIEDNEFKTWLTAGYFGPVQEYLDAVTDIDISDVMPTTINRLRYDVQTNTSDADDPLYGLPLDTQPTALYYNETVFEQVGIKIISVDEADLDAFNAGTKADRNGKKNSDYGLSGVEVPAKGYYRSENPYYDGGESWVKPTSDEVLVFNNRIAMNWDEIEDLAMLFSPEYNKNPNNAAVTEYGTTYGYFTEWWFNYGWSVGGDCLEDLTGNGDWNFSLLDPNKNYIVKEGKTYTGEYTGKVYQGGETLDFKDKLEIPKDAVITPDSVGGYTYNGNVVGNRATVVAAAQGADAVLNELPSTREAFNRYLRLGTEKGLSAEYAIDGVGGLGVSPNPNLFSQRTSTEYFCAGDIAILAQTSVMMDFVSEQMKLEKTTFNIAPLVRYKQYADPSDPQCDEVVVHGVEAGHSNTLSIVMSSKSSKKDKAAMFMKWAASREGQAIRAEYGFFPNQADLIDSVKFSSNVAPSNVRAFSEALEFQTPGDWWYMPDHLWVEQWCTLLNSDVRNGKMTYTDWIDHGGMDKKTGCVVLTNQKLEEYKKYKVN